MKALKISLVVIIAVVAAYFIGPQVEIGELSKTLPEVPNNLTVLEAFINEREDSIPNIKPDNEGRIIWANGKPEVTEYSIVYLHGFSASQEEGDPIHENLAKRYGCNLYLPRIAGHGLNEEEAMLDLTAEKMMQSAAEAIAIGMQIGKKVILVTTSTGGTYGLYLAENNPAIEALILYSPNIQIYDPNSWLLSKPWGLQLARLVKGTKYNEWEIEANRANYWTNKYRLEVLTELQVMVETTMTKETFEKVTQPVFLGYYYKNEEEQDNTVSVPAMLEMYEHLGTPDELKRKVAFPEAGHHVIGSDLTSGAYEQVEIETIKFLEEVVGLKPTVKKELKPETINQVSNSLKSILSEDIKFLSENDRKYNLEAVDLNGDNAPEYFVQFQSSYFCGSGGCTFLLLSSDMQLITRFTVTNAPIFVEPAFKNDWKILLTKSNDEFKEMAYDNGSYPSNPSILNKAPYDAPSGHAQVLFDNSELKYSF
ncbi:alpha/beta hydrolase [Fulvivirga lutea]|uniref:Alpha/beta hydrolase n=1 Tax=Fulvivirga lutea TaxID=2810512 RepID=A0A974WJ00_9BACT|nr:alpha/beta hydrolase [Fulvivirga lutea]QSE98012.1 alpha/beta hydrolase [Fulvivirga lutea]